MDTTTEDPGGGLYRLKDATARLLAGAVARAVAGGVSADSVTLAGLALGAGAAAAVLAGGHAGEGTAPDPRWWLAVGPLVALRLACAVADGQIARRSGTDRPAGAVLGEVADRVGDVLLAAALVVIAPVPAVLAVVGLLLADDVATIGWAVSGRRVFPGIGGKPDRSVLVAVGLAGAVWVPGMAVASAWALCALVWAALVVRLRAVMRAVA